MWSRWVWIGVLWPVCGFAATGFGLNLLVEECMDTRFHFKLLLWGPVVEELVFRAGLQAILMRKIDSSNMANCIASALFALTHFAVSGNVATLAVFVPSIALGMAYQRTNSVLLTIGLHILFNLIYLSLKC
jgi:membrane protease YdiL (CAAX protease family)